MRIELDAPPPPACVAGWVPGRGVRPRAGWARVPRRPAEPSLDHWEPTPRDFEHWSKTHLGGERFDPTLWCVVRAGDEIAAGTICMPDTYSGGWVQALFTRRPWRRRGLGAALLQGRIRPLLGSRRAQHRARGGRRQRDRRVSALRARRDGSSPRLPSCMRRSFAPRDELASHRRPRKVKEATGVSGQARKPPRTLNRSDACGSSFLPGAAF